MRKYSWVPLAFVATCLATNPSAPVAATPAAAGNETTLAPPSVAHPDVLESVAVPGAAAPAPAAFDADGLSPDVLDLALQSVAGARSRGVSADDRLLTVIDYSLPSTEPRLWVLDLERRKVLYRELVAHGRGTGDNYARHFSNVPDSLQTSLGLFLTGGTYQGGNGYSLKLRGLDPGLNDRAEERYIVMHGAWYVSPAQARSQGRLGRSWGCPAVSEAVAQPLIDTIKGGSFVFSYHPDEPRLAGSSTAPRVVTAATR